MRLATILEAGRPTVADAGLGASIREIAGLGPDEVHRLAAWVDAQPRDAGRPLDAVEFAAAIPDPGAIYTVGLNYRSSGDGPDIGADDRPDTDAPPRPLIYGKAATSVAGHGATLAWDRTLTANVDPEIELGVVIAATAADVPPETAMDHVFGYTCINDVSSRDAWLDGDQWLLGKSMPGFCPVGPWIVTADEIDPGDLRLGCTINGVPIQHGRTSQLRTPIDAVIAYLSRHATLRPGDLIATGTPPRLDGPLGPDRHLEPGDIVTVWVEGIGELTTTIA
jgi:2-keto-4-pentenoate hydratase/2-oxohepta-3-ene-1,7-dioic acid hydratase in catechol pathway